MKRSLKMLLSLLLIVGLLCGLAACADKEGPNGKYVLIEADGSSGYIDPETLESMAYKATITFDSDGTGEIDFFGEVMDFTWKGSEITLEDVTRSFTHDGDRIILENDGEKLIFEKK